MSLDYRALLATLHPHCGAALERAVALCIAGGHAAVESEHLLLELAGAENNDLACVLRACALAPSQVEAELRRALEGVERRAVREPPLGQGLVALLREAWVLASLHLGQSRVRSGSILLALLEHAGACARLQVQDSSLLRLDAKALRSSLDAWCASSVENTGAAGAPGASALAQYSTDLTAQARAGAIDPVIGRDGEIRQAVDILLRRRQNNPILVGEPGVGKTAVAEGLALRIAAGEVPPRLREVRLCALDLALLQAGAGMKGEFERRLKAVIDEVAAATTPVILFIDEAHMLIGAGGAAGQGDAANLLKPALARGALRTIAATTWQEYKKYVEKDPALARRFQLVAVEEPDERAAVEMLRAVAIRLERHHGVTILEGAVHEAVGLTQRYLPGRQLPDKAISVLDTACARVALGQHDTPPVLAQARRRIGAIEEELARLRREHATGSPCGERIAALEQERAEVLGTSGALELRWTEERAAVHEILALRRRIVETPGAPQGEDEEAAPANLAAHLRRLEAGLEAIRQDDPLVAVDVDARAVAAVVAAWTGIPVGRMLVDESHAVRNLHRRLAARVVGQDGALALIANRIKAYRAGLLDPGRPVGVFLLVGPSGVGKTETAGALADALYGGERNLVTINMSEYQEAHTVSQLKGAPPGYVGHGSGGVLTEAVRRKPYSVVLLDEFEKAHPDVRDVFYNVFDKGVLEDGTGLAVDFRNTVILATSNAGAELVIDACAGGARPAPAGLVERLQPCLSACFKAPLLARMAVVPYLALDEVALRAIVRMKLDRMAERAAAADPDFAGFGEDTAGWVLARCGPGGVRDIDRVIMDELAVRLADAILERGGAWHDKTRNGEGIAYGFD